MSPYSLHKHPLPLGYLHDGAVTRYLQVSQGFVVPENLIELGSITDLLLRRHEDGLSTRGEEPGA